MEGMKKLARDWRWGAPLASALTQSQDSQRPADVRCWVHGSDRLSVGLGRGSRSPGGDCRRSQPRPKARGAGSDHPPFGRPAERRGGRQARRGRPAGGVALAAAVRLAGVDSLLCDATRKPGKPRLDDAIVRRVVALTCTEPPGEVTHWTGRAMAKMVAISLRSVQRIWAGHDLQPHRIRTFKRSSDPDFAAKLEAIVGLYLDPPAHSLVLSLDEKSQIQALDRTQPGLPLKPGKAGTIPTTPSATARPRCSPPSTCSTARSSVAAWRAIATRSSCAS